MVDAWQHGRRLGLWPQHSTLFEVGYYSYTPIQQGEVQVAQSHLPRGMRVAEKAFRIISVFACCVESRGGHTIGGHGQQVLSFSARGKLFREETSYARGSSVRFRVDHLVV